MNKKLIGFIIIIILAVVSVSGCITDDNSSNDISDSGYQVNPDFSNLFNENSSSGIDSSSKINNNNSDPEPNEEPEPIVNDLL